MIKKLQFISLCLCLPLSAFSQDDWNNGFESAEGLFSGKKGGFTIYKSKDGNSEPAVDSVSDQELKEIREYKAIKSGSEVDEQTAKDYQDYLEFKKFQALKKQQTK